VGKETFENLNVRIGDDTIALLTADLLKTDPSTTIFPHQYYTEHLTM
jgi:hypothetical protein